MALTQKTGTGARYIDTADCAKLVRAALKRDFPDTKFSVKIHRYSGGSSINVHWTDGPLAHEVEAVATQFGGGRFDGMIDMAYDVDHYLLPDGSTELAYSPGTQAQMGVDPSFSTNVIPLRGERVRFCADYVFCTRELSDEFRAQMEAKIEIHARQPYDPNTFYSFCYDGEAMSDYGSTIVCKLANKISKNAA